MAGADHVQGVAIAVAVDADGPLIGLLLLGRAAIGKTSVALALAQTCPYQRSRIIADDMVVIEARADALFATAPEAIRGVAEIRGFGPAAIRTGGRARLHLAIMLTSSPLPRIANLEVWKAPASTPARPMELALLAYETTKFSCCDHAFRIRSILPSFLTGQTHRAAFCMEGHINAPLRERAMD